MGLGIKLFKKAQILTKQSQCLLPPQPSQISSQSLHRQILGQPSVSLKKDVSLANICFLITSG